MSSSEERGHLPFHFQITMTLASEIRRGEVSSAELTEMFIK